MQKFAILGAALAVAFFTTPYAFAQSSQDVASPYKAVMEMDDSIPNHTVYRPEDMTKVKGKLPVVALGNGGCMNAGNLSEVFLTYLASQGYVAVAAGPIVPDADAILKKSLEPPAPGATGPSGFAALPPVLQKRSVTSDLIQVMDWAEAQNKLEGSKFKGKLDTSKFAMMGMSCGGLMALDAAADPRVKTAVILNSGVIRMTSLPPGMKLPAGMDMKTMAANLPGSPESLKKLHTPVMYITGGEKDIAYKNAQTDFTEITQVPVFMANIDVGHTGTFDQPHGGKMGELTLSWLNWQLKGDKKAKALFTGDPCGLCTDSDWKIQRKNMP